MLRAVWGGDGLEGRDSIGRDKEVRTRMVTVSMCREGQILGHFECTVSDRQLHTSTSCGYTDKFVNLFLNTYFDL